MDMENSLLCSRWPATSPYLSLTNSVYAFITFFKIQIIIIIIIVIVIFFFFLLPSSSSSSLFFRLLLLPLIPSSFFFFLLLLPSSSSSSSFFFLLLLLSFRFPDYNPICISPLSLIHFIVFIPTVSVLHYLL